VVEKFRAKYGASDVKKYYSKFDVAVVAQLRRSAVWGIAMTHKGPINQRKSERWRLSEMAPNLPAPRVRT
jgi:hypothetical protein